MRMLLIAMVMLGSVASHAIPHRCSGGANCTACKNCSACKHCNAGGSCSVCKPEKYQERPAHKPAKKVKR